MRGKSITRYAAEGESGLAVGPAARTSLARTSARVEECTVDLRGRERRGPAWIDAELGVPARTVSCVLVRRGQPRVADLDLMTGQVSEAPARNGPNAVTPYRLVPAAER